MSDLRPTGIPAVLDGQEINLLIHVSAINEIQAKCNMPFMDAMNCVGRFADREYTDENVKTFLKVAAVVINDSNGMAYTEEELAKKLSITDDICWKILEAYGLSFPDRDEDEDYDEDEEKNVETGR